MIEQKKNKYQDNTAQAYANCLNKQINQSMIEQKKNKDQDNTAQADANCLTQQINESMNKFTN